MESLVEPFVGSLIEPLVEPPALLPPVLSLELLPPGPAPPDGVSVLLGLELLPALPEAPGSDEGVDGALDDEELVPVLGVASSPLSHAAKVADNNKAGASTRYFFIAISCGSNCGRPPYPIPCSLGCDLSRT